MASLLENYPPPGKLCRVNQHRLHIQQLGQDGPTILFEAGQAGFSLDWMLVQPEVSRFARTYCYDRAGLGWSEAGPRPRTPLQVMAEFQALVAAASIPKPFVLVAHSLGGRYVRMYMRQHPEDVLGLVLFDGYHEAFDIGLGKERLAIFLRNRSRQYRSLDLMARLGVVRLLSQQVLGLLGPDYRNIPNQERKRYLLLASRPNAMATTIDEHEQAAANLLDATSGVMPNDLPLRILTHGVPWPYPEYERLWQESQRRAGAWSTRSKLTVAERSGHAIQFAQPELVIDTIREIVTEVRNSYI